MYPSDSRITESCQSFPSEKICSVSPDLCHSWKTAAFLIILSSVLEGMTLIAYLVVFNGGYVRRQNGWKVLSFLLLLIGELSTYLTDVGCAQLPATLLILHELGHSDLFVLPDWRVDDGWILATVSYSLVYLSAIIMAVLGKFSPDEYTLIPSL